MNDSERSFTKRTIEILEMIAIGEQTSKIYDAIALLYESRHPGIRCSMLELENGKLLHGGAPSLPKAYCQAVHGLEYGPNIGSCGTATYTGKRCIVEDINSDPKWANLKQFALPHGLRCCWSEPIKDSSGKVLGAFGMYYNHPAAPNEQESQDLLSAARLAGLVMERDHNQKQIKELAFVDSLTKLSSRAYFFQHLDSLIKSSSRLRRKFSLLFLDLDDFKSVNDTQGHDIGDLLLSKIAEKLTNICREIDFIARLGGDEFCIVTEYDSNNEHTEELAKVCLQQIAEPILLNGTEQKFSCSIGIACYPTDGNTASILLKAADTALYAAKEQGKQCYSFYKPELTKKVEYRLNFERALKNAVNNNEMTLVYQPKVNILGGYVSGAEALARWHSQALGEISPIEFISAIERLGIMPEFTEWVLHQACMQAVDWKNRENLDLSIAVNVSPSLFLNKEIVKLIERTIYDTGMNPNQLELEVTENVFQRDYQNLNVFKEIKYLGVKIAIDDFGTGYSSFASLKHINIDILKIDKYFIKDILNDPNSVYLISSIVDICRKFGYETVAEGVELESQLKILQELKCKNVQGWNCPYKTGPLSQPKPF
ncbi:TPA: EAL domain-containing protein [Legionella pneumophila]|nr:EAL domain-containing protein [Legionella pneumophila]HAT8869166.1 EAL domain-containing protein [Legionella pneumophila subsp. pneumophila]HAT7073856.1 EAL domain-containing protein [Legionella pneumophila]HAT8642742.1 EAL domain-containing protein [Legionella pneumophila]HAT8890777.1 EAL domain-containing protein [Legionella pneumophila subsp. pneumophila]HAT8934334.1 EAL domain-containing protein [Legionella pneumophila subsp. pneumophila]